MTSASDQRPGAVEQLIAERDGDLTPDQRKIAALILDHPENVAFTTVSLLAAETGAAAEAVTSLATLLGYENFQTMQGALRMDIADRGGNAFRPPTTDGVDATLERGVETLRETLGGIDREAFGRILDLLTDQDRGLWLLPSEQMRPSALFLWHRVLIAKDAQLLEGAELAIASMLSLVKPGDVVLVIDTHPYEAATVRLTTLAGDIGATVVSLLDSPDCAIGRVSDHTLTFSTAGAGAAASQLGLLGLVEAIIFEVTVRSVEPGMKRWSRLMQVLGQSKHLITED